MYGQKLQRAIRTFLDDFVHHMEQVRITFTLRHVLLTVIFYQFWSILITQTHISFSKFRKLQEEAIFQPLLADNFDDTELEAMNKTVTEQHAIYKEKIKSEKSLKAVKRKLSDEVFDAEDDFGLDSQLRFKKSYCQEVNERLSKKVNEKEDSELLPSQFTIQEILTADKTKAATLSRYV